MLLLVVASQVPAQQPAQPVRHFDGNTWWGHVKFIADDSLEGRETGSEG